EELLAQRGRGRDAEVPRERGDDVAAAFDPGGKTEAGLRSHGVRHSASVPSDGSAGTDGLAGTVPLGDGRGRVEAGLGSGWRSAGSGMMSSLGTSGLVAAPSATDWFAAG